LTHLVKQSACKELIGLNLPHALKSIIRQEQINDLILLDPWQRFLWVKDLLSTDGTADLAEFIHKEINPLFRLYLDFLFPLGEGHLKVLEQNGRNGLEIEVILPGNRRRKSHQLSGGEKSITSLALKLAIFGQLDCPFYSWMKWSCPGLHQSQVHAGISQNPGQRQATRHDHPPAKHHSSGKHGSRGKDKMGRLFIYEVLLCDG